MKKHILRDSFDARRFLTQGLWWQRVLPPQAKTLRSILTWTKELASEGHPLPPIGFIADLGHVTFGEDRETRSGRDPISVPNLPINLVRTYEDHVMGKIYADYSFARAGDALRQYPPGRDQARGLAYFLEQFRKRARYDGVELPVGVLNALLETSPEEVLVEGYESMRQQGPHPLLTTLYESLIQSARRTAEVLAPEDIFDLETRAALEKLADRMAHRFILEASSQLEATLPRHKLRPLPRRMEVPTRILDEDTYPVGGFTSVSNRGSIESLLHSQLAYMEPDKNQHPDLFDTLYLMDELLYYSRDENQFLRRRRTFVLVLCPDLSETRHKDAQLSHQRIVMLQGLIHVLVKKLAEWLSTDALNFQIVFLGMSDPHPLAIERTLFGNLFRDEIATGIVHLLSMEPNQLGKFCEDWARKSMVHCLVIGKHPPRIDPRDTVVNRLVVQSARPALGDGSDDAVPAAGDEPLDSWSEALQQILMRWI